MEQKKELLHAVPLTSPARPLPTPLWCTEALQSMSRSWQSFQEETGWQTAVCIYRAVAVKVKADVVSNSETMIRKTGRENVLLQTTARGLVKEELGLRLFVKRPSSSLSVSGRAE